jgi:hypothetical protein
MCYFFENNSAVQLAKYISLLIYATDAEFVAGELNGFYDDVHWGERLSTIAICFKFSLYNLCFHYTKKVDTLQLCLQHVRCVS